MRVLQGSVAVLVALALPASAGAVGSVRPGTLSVVAGLIGGSRACADGLPAPGPATSACLGGPTAVAADQAGNAYVADGAGNVVVKITASGVLSIVAGTGRQGAPTPGPATQSSLDDPSGVAVDAAGDVYIADQGNDVVEKVTPSGVLSIVAGTGRQGAPRPGPATASDLGRPVAIALGPTGDLYIADQLNREVEEVTPQGLLSVVAGSGRAGTPVPGPATRSPLGWPAGVAVSPAGNLYIADLEPSAVIEKVTAAGRLSIVAGIPRHHGQVTPGPARRSELGGPVAVAVNAAGELYIADLPCDCVEQVTPGGVISVIAGSVAVTRPGADQAQLNTFVYPQGLALGPGGDLYIASTQAGVILRLADAPRAHAQGPPTIAASPLTVHGSEITQTLACVSGTARCVLAATLRTASGGRRALILAHRQLTIPVGSFRTLTLTPNRTGRRLLQARRLLRTSLTITARRPTRLTRPIQGILFPAPLRRIVLLRSAAA